MESVRQEILDDPDKNAIAVVLNEALRRNYMQANVEWVTSYPDLSLFPYNLAAPGISGNTALLDFGHVSYFRRPFTEMKVYNFKHFLKLINRDNNNSFIFGHGVFQRLSRCSLSEIVLNALFPPATSREREKNSSGLVTIDTRGKCKKEILKLSKLQCAVQGTYFLSEGLKIENESVLKVYAKGPYSDRTPFCGSKRFINLMQEALQDKFGSEHFVALGGVYTVSKVIWGHECIRNDWEPLEYIPGICHVNQQRDEWETMIATFNSSKKFRPTNHGPSIIFNSSQSFHSLSHHSALENHPIIRNENQEEEYVGYFCPAKTLYRIDQPDEPF